MTEPLDPPNEPDDMPQNAMQWASFRAEREKRAALLRLCVSLLDIDPDEVQGPGWRMYAHAIKVQTKRELDLED